MNENCIVLCVNNIQNKRIFGVFPNDEELFANTPKIKRLRVKKIRIAFNIYSD